MGASVRRIASGDFLIRTDEVNTPLIHEVPPSPHTTHTQQQPQQPRQTQPPHTPGTALAVNTVWAPLCDLGAGLAQDAELFTHPRYFPKETHGRRTGAVAFFMTVALVGCVLLAAPPAGVAPAWWFLGGTMVATLVGANGRMDRRTCGLVIGWYMPIYHPMPPTPLIL